MTALVNSIRRVGAPGSRRGSVWIRWAVVTLIFVGYALRTGTLTLQSMWIDEIATLSFTSGSLREVIPNMVRPEHNGPLFYLLLFLWRQVAGSSDFAIRYTSVVYSTITIALLFRLVKEVLTDRTAIASVWLLAFSPFTLWYAQETKMYALHIMVAVASSLMLVEAFRKGGWWRWLVYAVLVSTVLYSHFFGAFLIASQAMMALLLGWRKWRRLLAYIAAMSSLLLAHLPLARIALSVLKNFQTTDVWRGFVPLNDIVRDAVSYYFYRVPVIQVSWPMLVLPIGLVIAGTILMLLLRQREPWVFVLQAFVPVLLFYVVSFRAPVYDAKYISAVLPAVYVLVAWGAEALSHLWRPLGVLLLILGLLMTNSVVRDLTDPAFQRGDWRYVADYVDEHEGDDDVVVVSAYYVTRAVRRYFQGNALVRGFGEDPYDPWPFYQRQAEGYDHLWLVLHHDQAMAPENRLREVAGIAFPVVTEQYPNMGRIALIGYQLRFSYPTLPEKVTPLDACFENGMCLAGYWIDSTSLSATEQLAHPPSGWIHVVLYWSRQAEVNDALFRPLVWMVDDQFNVWGGNMDRRPDLFDRYPLSDWPTDEVVETNFDINLNPVTPPGTYQLVIGLAGEQDPNSRIPLLDPPQGQPAEYIVLAPIQIEPGQ